MNLVAASLHRPLTAVVLVLAACRGGWPAIQRMARDIFPPLGIPTIYVASRAGFAPASARSPASISRGRFVKRSATFPQLDAS